MWQCSNCEHVNAEENGDSCDLCGSPRRAAKTDNVEGTAPRRRRVGIIAFGLVSAVSALAFLIEFEVQTPAPAPNSKGVSAFSPGDGQRKTEEQRKRRAQDERQRKAEEQRQRRAEEQRRRRAEEQRQRRAEEQRQRRENDAGRRYGSQDPNLKVLGFTTARKVKNREPVDVTDVFSTADGTAYAHARISYSGGPTHVVFRWFHKGEHYFDRTEKVKTSPHWRTYASVKLQPGPWQVQLLAPNGTVMAEKRFTVK